MQLGNVWAACRLLALGEGLRCRCPSAVRVPHHRAEALGGPAAASDRRSRPEAGRGPPRGLGEFSPHLLRPACPAALRPHLLRTVLEELWPGRDDASRFDLEAIGIRLPQPGGGLVVRLQLRAVICDHAALAAGLGLKGSSGTKPCHVCSNVVGGETGRDAGGHLAPRSRCETISDLAAEISVQISMSLARDRDLPGRSFRLRPGWPGGPKGQAGPAHAGQLAGAAAALGGRGCCRGPQGGTGSGRAGPRRQARRRRPAVRPDHSPSAAVGPPVLRSDALGAQPRHCGLAAGRPRAQGLSRRSDAPGGGFGELGS